MGACFVPLVFAAPNISATFPLDGAYNDTFDPAAVLFNCAANDTNLSSVSLYITNHTNGNFSLNQTTNASSNETNANWTLSLVNGTYTWGCLANTTLGELNWTTNRTFAVNYTDAQAPNVTAQSPSSIASLDPQTIASLSCSFSDNFRLANASLYLTNATNESFSLYETQTISDTSASINWSVLFNPGNYTWNCLVTDYYSNSLWGENFSVLVNGTQLNITNANSSYNFTTIQDAINNASIGDILNIPGSSYYENLIINKSVTLNGTGSSIIGAQNLSSAIIIASDSVRLDGLNVTRGVLRVLNMTNITITNTLFSGANLSLIRTNGSTFTDINFVGATMNGTGVRATTLSDISLTHTTCFSFTNTSASTFIGLSASGCSIGFTLTNSSSNTLRSSTFSGFTDGVFLNSSSSNTLSSLTTNTNSRFGIYLLNSANNIITSIVARSNLRGVMLSNADGTVLNRSNITSNSGFGVYLTGVSGAEITDNYFVNTNNTYDDGANIWDDTRSGTNILGGDSLGGNYYGSPTNNGCSQDNDVYDEDGDFVADEGVCQIPGGSSEDDNPLTYNEAPSSSSGSGGSPPANYEPPSRNYYSYQTIFNNVIAYTPYSWTLSDEKSLFRKIMFASTKDVDRITLKLTQYATRPSYVPQGMLEAIYVRIDPVGIASRDAEDVIFEIALEAKQDVFILEGEEWQKLEKNYIDGNFRIKSPHLSWFAIGQLDVPPPAPYCGDGIIQANEECDGNNIDGAICNAGTSGTVTCSDCKLDKSTCLFATCSLSCLQDGVCNEACAQDTMCSKDPDCIVCPLACGADGVCEEGCAANNQCALDPDCAPLVEEPAMIKESNMIFYLTAILVALVLLGGIGSYVVLSKKNKPSIDRHVETNPFGETMFDRRVQMPSHISWVQDHINKGYEPQQILEALERKGWTREQALGALHAAQPIHTHNILRYRKQVTKKNKLTLQHYVAKLQAQRMPPAQIRSRLEDAGWDPILVEEAMEEPLL